MPRSKRGSWKQLLKEEKTLAQIASEYEVHLTQLKNWRAVALEGLPSLFEKQDSTTELYAEIGKLSTKAGLAEKNRQGKSHVEAAAAQRASREARYC